MRAGPVGIVYLGERFGEDVFMDLDEDLAAAPQDDAVGRASAGPEGVPT